MAQFQSDNADSVQFVFRHLPLDSIHDKASLASQAAEAAGLQGKFWEMHDVLMDSTNWSVWTALAATDFPNWLKENAGKVDGLDVDQFMKDLTSQKIVDAVELSYNSATQIGLSGTPSIYIFMDGDLYFTPDDGIAPYYQTLDAIFQNYVLEQEKAYSQCPAMTIDVNKTYTATVKTTKGEFVMELYPKSAPLTVNSFIFLAKDGWFENVPFHRVIADFVAQTGDPTGTGIGGPGYHIKDEIDPNLLYDKEGVVGMANSGANTNGSQFFITLAAQPNLDGRYTIFARVVSGMDVVRSITQRDPSAQTELPEPDRILSVTITEK